MTADKRKLFEQASGWATSAEGLEALSEAVEVAPSWYVELALDGGRATTLHGLEELDAFYGFFVDPSFFGPSGAEAFARAMALGLTHDPEEVLTWVARHPKARFEGEERRVALSLEAHGNILNIVLSADYGLLVFVYASRGGVANKFLDGSRYHAPMMKAAKVLLTRVLGGEE